MQSKLWSIAKRECVIRMNKPAFWVLSLLGPLVVVCISVVPYALTSNLKEKKEALVNVSDSMSRHFPLSIGDYEVKLMHASMEEAYVQFLSGEEKILCDLFVGKDTVWTIYTKEVLHPADSLNLVRTLGLISPAPASIRSHIVAIEQSKEEQGFSFSPLQQTVALGAAILVYFFLFTYSVSLLKGVMEEKGNKVMDLLLSSVSPSSWIMGKITGVGIASFVQFIVWLLMSYIPFYFFKHQYGNTLNSFSAAHIHGSLRYTEQADLHQAMGWYDWLTMINGIHWVTLLITMVFAMVFGFILYAAVFAMIGMLSGRESDAQPYVLPVTSPLIFSFITSSVVIADPYGSLAQWLSIIPFTAPVVLTLRAGLGVAFSELIVSLIVLGLFSITTVSLSGRLYKRMLNNGGMLFRFEK